jgi:hypothetical protein
VASRRTNNLIVNRLYQAQSKDAPVALRRFYRSLQTQPKPRAFAELTTNAMAESSPFRHRPNFARFPSLRELWTGVVLPEFRRS